MAWPCSTRDGLLRGCCAASAGRGMVLRGRPPRWRPRECAPSRPPAGRPFLFFRALQNRMQGGNTERRLHRCRPHSGPDPAHRRHESPRGVHRTGGLFRAAGGLLDRNANRWCLQPLTVRIAISLEELDATASWVGGGRRIPKAHFPRYATRATMRGSPTPPPRGSSPAGQEPDTTPKQKPRRRSSREVDEETGPRRA